MTSLPNLSQLDELIQLMMSAAIYSADELKDLRKKDKQRESGVIARMFEKGESYGVASGGPAFLNQPEDAFFAYMKSIDNDLDVHVGIVKDAFKLYVQRGEIPAPHYAWRIAVILRKAKMKEKEKEFLTAWCRHFGKIERRAGVTYADLAERAAKMGITYAD